MDHPGRRAPSSATALSTDLYEISMVAGYVASGITGAATFDLYVRALPSGRAFLVAAGLEQALAYLESLRFGADEIAYLRGLPQLRAVPADFFERYLPAFRFSGDVWAVPEGCPVFAQMPLVRVTAPMPEAQLVETSLLAIITFQTAIATKAVRLVETAGARPVIEFGSRRAHGVEAGLYAARAAFVGGCAGTSNVEAGFRFGIPVSGTMAHSWVMRFENEVEAFRRYLDLYGSQAVLLIDTYDTLEAARRVVAAGLRPAAVRLDSGDLALLSHAVRRLFDDHGLQETKIFASGDLDEHVIARLLAAGAPIDGFGVGTALSTSSDAPSLGGVYKLAEFEQGRERVPTLKLSAGKRTYPGQKQVWRTFRAGVATGDLIGLATEGPPPGGVPLLRPVMRNGLRIEAPEPIASAQARCRTLVSQLPASLRRLDHPGDYEVTTSPALEALASRVMERIARA